MSDETTTETAPVMMTAKDRKTLFAQLRSEDEEKEAAVAAVDAIEAKRQVTLEAIKTGDADFSGWYKDAKTGALFKVIGRKRKGSEEMSYFKKVQGSAKEDEIKV